MLVTVYQKGADGLPTTTRIAELTPVDLSFSWGALWGPLTATVTLGGSLDDAFHMADTWLGNEVKIYSDDGDWLWEGLIWTISFSYGRRSRRRSLEGYANRAEVHYQRLDAGFVDLRAADDLTQQAVYGRIEHHENAGPITTDAAIARAAAVLAARTRLLWLPESGTLGTDATGDARITLECYGWYRTLWYQAYRDTAPATTADVTAMVAAVVTAKAPFIAADTSRLATTGTDTDSYVDTYESAGEVIKRLMGLASGYTFRIDQDRVPVIEADRRLATTPDYFEDVFGAVTQGAGQPVPLYLIRPDRVVRQQDFVPVSFGSDAAVDTISAVYLSEIEYRMPGILSYKTSVAGERGEVES